jgi:tetratricopeptide (TPR) repeat protein
VRAETRRQLRTDRFSKATFQAAEQTVHWTVEHRSKITIAAVVIVVVVSAVLGGWYYLLRQDEKASVDFGKAVTAMNTPVRPAGMPAQPEYPSFASAKERDTDAHKQFQGIVDHYPHTRSADFARYFLGVTAADLGDYASAERDLKQVAGYYNSELSSLAKLALASVYRNTNRTKDAVDLYKQLIDKPSETVGKSAAEFQLAETYRAAGMTADAKKLYEQIQKDDPKGPGAQLSGQKLQELK